MALAFSCGFTGRVLFKPRIVRAGYSSGKSSKIPSLMRYIPKESRKFDKKKLESVQFPQHQGVDNSRTVYHEDQTLELGSEDEQEASTTSRNFHERQIFHRGKSDISSFRLVPASQISSSGSKEVVKNSEADQASKITRVVQSSVEAGERIEPSSTSKLENKTLSSTFVEEETGEKLGLETKNAAEAPAKNKALPRNKPASSPFTIEEFGAFLSKQTTLEPGEEDVDFEASEDGFEEDEFDETPLSPSNNPGEKSAAKNYAVFLLSRWQRTAAELRKKMNEKNYSPEVIDHTLSELRKDGLQSDTSYTEVFVQSRWNSRGWGPKRIRYELLRKGVDAATVDKAIQRVFQSENNSESEEAHRWGMSREAVEHLIKLSARKWSSGGDGVPVEVRSRRLAGWLQRRGFDWKVIKGVTDVFQKRDPFSETQLVEDFEDATV